MVILSTLVKRGPFLATKVDTFTQLCNTFSGNLVRHKKTRGALLAASLWSNNCGYEKLLQYRIRFVKGLKAVPDLKVPLIYRFLLSKPPCWCWWCRRCSVSQRCSRPQTDGCSAYPAR